MGLPAFLVRHLPAPVHVRDALPDPLGGGTDLLLIGSQRGFVGIGEEVPAQCHFFFGLLVRQSASSHPVVSICSCRSFTCLQKKTTLFLFSGGGQGGPCSRSSSRVFFDNVLRSALGGGSCSGSEHRASSLVPAVGKDLGAAAFHTVISHEARNKGPTRPSCRLPRVLLPKFRARNLAWRGGQAKGGSA